jgi:hypothetical protein
MGSVGLFTAVAYISVTNCLNAEPDVFGVFCVQSTNSNTGFSNTFIQILRVCFE